MTQKYCLLLFNCYNGNGNVLLDKFAIYKVDRETLFHYYVKTTDLSFTVKLSKRDRDRCYFILKG
jgi:hypothetical protein